MASIQKSLRIPEETAEEIEKLAAQSGKGFAVMAKDLLEEGLRARRCPGIVFAEGPAGIRARVAGTGIEVWEIIAAFKSVSEDFNELKKAFHWLRDQQLKSALAYYTLFPEEIDRSLRLNEAWDKKKILSRFPFLEDFGRQR
jgi:uncharacterized protein (DUF433 family)